MKPSLLFLFIIPVLFTQGQSVIGEEKNALIEAYDIAGKRIPLGDGMEPEGNKMLNDQYTAGVVKFIGIPAAYHLMINFSLLDNELFFKKDSLVLAFANPVDSFSIPVKSHGEERIMNFKRGFPDIGSNNEKSFYQILCDGAKVKLLKYIYKVKEERYAYGGPSTKEYTDRYRLFVFNLAERTMTEIKPAVKSIEKALPEYTALIEKFAKENKINGEGNLIALISFINTNKQ